MSLAGLAASIADVISIKTVSFVILSIIAPLGAFIIKMLRIKWRADRAEERIDSLEEKLEQLRKWGNHKE